ncbi:MAG: hypothetical protein M0T85_07675 [Dehalococcoidales bacterium]|nr:hypothetical protein [Dehalococcoidales bacterium]
MTRIAALAELCLLAWGLYIAITDELVSRLGSTAIENALIWLRWLLS